MELSEIFQSLGRPALDDLVRRISLGTLRAFKMYDQFKVWSHLNKLNTEHLRKAIPRFWERLEQHDEDLAQQLAQAVLVSNTDFVVQVLDYLKIPHDDNGFFQKDVSTEQYLTEGWQQRVFDEFKARYPEPLLRLYINHLMWEVNKQAAVWQGNESAS